MTRVVIGLVGGAAGTVAMTTAMAVMHRLLPARDRYPLPPRQVAMAAADKSGIGRPAHEEDRRALTLASHFAYGISMGAMYALLVQPRRPAPALTGSAFAMAVWSGSYLGWLPATGLHPPATREPLSRNALMIAAHLVWGSTVGLVTAALAPEPAADGRSRPR
jgi:uncharacterized membrane protein YagU involved in acid resistance